MNVMQHPLQNENFILWHDAQKPELWSETRRSLQGNDSVNTFPRQRIRNSNYVISVAMQRRSKHAFPTIERLCFLPGRYKEEFSWEELSRVSRRQPTGIWAREQRNWTESCLRNWQFQNNGKKGIRLWNEDFMYDLKWQWECYKFIARIRLMKTENPCACVTINYKVRRSATAL
jgi:hypothetical protein